MEIHATLREEVQPTASNMQLLTYSAEMEKLADDFLRKCDITSGPAGLSGIGYVGPFTKPHKFSYSDELMKINSDTYNYKENKCTAGCLDYKQMVWATSTQVGCAANKCPDRSNGSKFTYVMICIYTPGKESVQERPYEDGSSCSRCPDNYGCDRNQCFKNATVSSSLSTAPAKTFSTTRTLTTMESDHIGTRPTRSMSLKTTSVSLAPSKLEVLLFFAFFVFCFL
uniref:SCP domain-containing protein n=1 Tax=Mesocestoides corti TaxID=53468 RepID=A0A5K3EME8_MESCO